MNLSMKYVRLSVTVVLLFVVLIFSEVRSSLDAAAGALTDLRTEEGSVLTPGEILARKRTLLIERERLLAVRKQRFPEKDQNEGSLFGYLASSASDRKIILAAFSPTGVLSKEGMTQLSFELNFTAGFHRAAAYLNTIETGSFPIKITGLSIVSDPPGNPALKVSLSGMARLLSARSTPDRK